MESALFLGTQGPFPWEGYVESGLCLVLSPSTVAVLEVYQVSGDYWGTWAIHQYPKGHPKLLHSLRGTIHYPR